jgi:hypothetical protein
MKRNNVYVDCEFIRYAQGIQLVSIGLVKSTGETYYAISSEFEPSLANDWVSENVLPLLETAIPRKSLAKIAQEIPIFVGNQVGEFWGYLAMYDWWLIVQLYGGNIQKMPYNLPIYCKELKQEIERLRFPIENLPTRPEKHHALLDAQWCKEVHQTLVSFENLTPSIFGI